MVRTFLAPSTLPFQSSKENWGANMGIGDVLKDFSDSVVTGAAQTIVEESKDITVRVNLDIPMDDKAIIALAFSQIKEQAKEAADKIDRRWKITQVMFGIAIGLQALATIVNI